MRRGLPGPTLKEGSGADRQCRQPPSSGLIYRRWAATGSPGRLRTNGKGLAPSASSATGRLFTTQQQDPASRRPKPRCSAGGALPGTRERCGRRARDEGASGGHTWWQRPQCRRASRQRQGARPNQPRSQVQGPRYRLAPEGTVRPTGRLAGGGAPAGLRDPARAGQAQGIGTGSPQPRCRSKARGPSERTAPFPCRTPSVEGGLTVPPPAWYATDAVPSLTPIGRRRSRRARGGISSRGAELLGSALSVWSQKD